MQPGWRNAIMDVAWLEKCNTECNLVVEMHHWKMLQGCKWHSGGKHPGRMRCPFCLVLPCLTVLQKISNHLELVKGQQLIVVWVAVMTTVTHSSASWYQVSAQLSKPTTVRCCTLIPDISCTVGHSNPDKCHKASLSASCVLHQNAVL